MSGLEEPRGEELPEHSLAAQAESFREAWRVFGREVAGVARSLGLLRRETKGAIVLAAASGRIATAGEALGLTPEETTEVAETWLAWARERGLPRPYGTIRRALVDRALGEEWRPRDTVDGLPDRG